MSRRAAFGGLISAACVGAGFALGRGTAPERVRTELVEGVGSGDKITSTNALRREDQPDAIFSVSSKEKVVGMTFDDGPDIRYTQHVLDLLKQYKAHATFFEIGVNALALPEVTLAVKAAGHSIGNHTYDHADLELLEPEAIDSEIDRGEDALIRVGVPRPTLFRPPKGLTDEVVGIFAEAARYRTVFWTMCVEAFCDHQDVATGVRQMLAKVRPGDIILAHDGGHVIGVPGRPHLSRQRTMEALPMLFAGLAERGYRIIDIPRLVQVGPTRQGHNVVGI